jgi:GH15 family glucan-1,4-alpha-glucosidase
MRRFRPATQQCGPQMRLKRIEQTFWRATVCTTARPASDPRVQGTLRAVEDKLVIDAEFVLRYETEDPGDGLPEGEGAFLGCSFWLVDNYI